MILGTMAISDFPLTPICLTSLCKWVDKVIIRFDAHKSRKIHQECLKNAEEVLGKGNVISFYSDQVWRRWNWREELIKACRFHKPEIVINMDHDETLEDEFAQDLENFVTGEFDLMRFHYVMATQESRDVPRYPRAAHFKVYRWKHDMTFNPYRGYARPNYPSLKSPKTMMAKSNIIHYCFYTEELQRTKIIHR